MAIYAIGDLQGCYDPFRHLLDAIAFDPDKDTLWLAGDLVNRGPKSLKTLRYVRSLGDSVVTVLGNHDLHALALSAGALRYGKRFGTLKKLLDAPDANELFDWLRHQPLAHYNKKLNTLLVHAGAYPTWSVKKTLALAHEVENELQNGDFRYLLKSMYGNSPRKWSGKLTGEKRLRFIINCLTRMRMLNSRNHLNMSFSGPPWNARRDLHAWFDVEGRRTEDTRIVFGHWSQLGLIALPNLISIDTGCVWSRQLTAVRLDSKVPRIVQVAGQYY